jgi:hypothetical protein
MSYKCTNQFVSSKGRRYTYGEKISFFEFNSLLFGEQRQFTRYVDDESSSLSSNNDNFLFTPTLFGSSEIYDNSPSFDNNSSSSFDGFGGGDSGGAGASGDW